MLSDHPFSESSVSKVTGCLLILLAMFVQWALLVMYADTPPVNAVVDSILSIGLLSGAGYAVWYMIHIIKVWQAQLIIALAVQAVCLGLTYSVLSLSELTSQEIFLESLPLRFFFGLLCWVILLQWYWMIQKERENKEEKETFFEHLSFEESSALEQQEILGKISVKDGGRIHIIPLNELFCIQASGDYATLFTPSGQYIKEQTMKYFEKHLPADFVRIHRSSIVNINYIMRMELFGKDSYYIRLKNGTSLRASGAGYKLLKERLNL